MKTLFILDDHAMLRNGIASFFSENTDWQILEQAGSKEEFLKKIEILAKKETLPDILICDINLNKENSGFEIMEFVRQSYPSIKVIAYSMFESTSYLNKAISFGAKGYVAKSKDESELLKCVEKVYKGDSYFTEHNIESLIVYSNVLSSLTKREKTVFDLILSRKSNTEIATLLDLNKRTVDNYVSCIYDKTNCKDRRQLIQKFGEVQL